MRSFWITIWALLVASSSFAQEKEFSWAARAVDSGRSVVQKLRTRQGLCILTITIGGKNHDFLLDTGAPTVISTNLAERLSLAEEGTVRVVDALGKAGRVPVVNIPALSVSGMEISGIPALVYEETNPVFTALQVQGILGSNALQQLVVSVSFREQNIRFASNEQKKGAMESTAMNLSEDAQGSPFIQLSLGGKAEDFLFDSGFEGLLDLMDQTAVVANGAVAVRTLREEGAYTGIHGGSAQSQTVSVETLRFPNATLHKVQASLTGDSRSKIGAALFTLGDVTLDYRARRFSFVPYLPK